MLRTTLSSNQKLESNVCIEPAHFSQKKIFEAEGISLHIMLQIDSVDRQVQLS